MTPRSSSFRTRLEMVLMLASVALAMSRYDFRASAFNSRRILTSSSSRVVGSAIESLRPTAAVLEVYDGLGGPSNIISFHINIPSIRTISPRNSLYMFKFLPRQRTERWLRPGGKAMAISASSPAKSKKMTVASVLKRIETEGVRWTDLQFVDEGGSHERFTRDSRYIAQRAAQFAADQGYDTTYWGPEIEFFVFDGIRLVPSADSARNPWSGAGYEIISREAPWSDSGGKEFPIRFKEGYYPAPPVDSLQDYRNEACRVLIESFGMTLDAHHHEVATAGQCEIDMRYDELVPMADNVVTYRYVMKMVAHKMGMMATFMPKPIFGDNASGMHVHQSLWSKGKNMMYDPNDDYAEISQTCRYYIGGLMDHARSLCAFTNPTTNSYRRLVPGYEAARFPDGMDRAPADGLHVAEDGLPAAPPGEVRGAEARRATASLATALAVRVLPVHGRLSQAGIGSLTPSQTTAVVRWPTGGVEIRHARVRSVRIQPSNTAPGAGLARRASMASIQVFLDNWFVRHLGALKTTMRVIFGVVGTIDGAFKFQPGFADSLAQMISDAAHGQPSWLQPWFGFWSQTVSANPGFFVTTIGVG